MSECPKPIGLTTAMSKIERLCANCVPYEFPRISPMLMELGSGDGQTTFTRYVAYMLVKHKVRQIVGLTTYLEFTVDIRKDQMQIMFGEIEFAAKGVNNFEGVIALDITALCECPREEQTTYFLKRLQEVAKSAVVLLFITPSKVKNNTKYNELKEKLVTTITGLTTVEVEPYTNAELAQMVLVKLDDYGIDIVDKAAFSEKLERVVEESNIAYARRIEGIAETLAKQAYVDRFSAVLDPCGLARAFPDLAQKGGSINGK